MPRGRAKYQGSRQSSQPPRASVSPRHQSSEAGHEIETQSNASQGEEAPYASQADLQRENEELLRANAELERRLNEAEGGLGTTSTPQRGRGAYSGGSFGHPAATPVHALAQYRQGTLKALPTDTPTLKEDVDVYPSSERTYCITSERGRGYSGELSQSKRCSRIPRSGLTKTNGCAL